MGARWDAHVCDDGCSLGERTLKLQDREDNQVMILHEREGDLGGQGQMVVI